MAAPKNNEYWKLRSKDGRDKIFKTPADLANACNEYFKWCQDNPLQEQVVFHALRVVTKDTINKMRPLTLSGLCNFIDISEAAFKLYENREDFIGVTTRVRQIIYNQKFEGAAAGFLNPNIIARDLGLADKREVDQKGSLSIQVTPDQKSKLDDLMNDID